MLPKIKPKSVSIMESTIRSEKPPPKVFKKKKLPT